MHDKVICLRPTATLRAAAGTLRRHHISGAPVVDAEGNVVGVLSERDIVESAVAGLVLQSPRKWLDMLLGRTAVSAMGPLQVLRDRIGRLRVEEVMTSEVVSIDPDEEVTEAALRMDARGFHRLPVVKDGRLVGIVARSDVPRSSAATSE
ncbi:MAG: CBS domain-containing protein [Euryarchaeota archaeon]|nr:CBS domain-containing protein [Euryarchaeota archaeon]MDE1835362.1 CBS domain-containing protein [Euryarchaeota archaeon]MDE1880465.1 CBS domain-containing protein [Euryarchaeota archaeon]MDE2043658.1 CBS domain-containing protein [Thermoplasmata archaeon]